MKFERFSNILIDSTSNYYKIRKEDYLPNGSFPIIDQGQTFIGGYSNDEKLIVNDNLPVIVFGDHTKILKYVDFPFIIGADGVKVLSLKNSSHIAKYYYYYLKTLKLPDAGYSRHFKFLKESKMPITDKIEVQIYIANILTKAENLITQRKESIRLLDEYLKSTFLEMFGQSNKSIHPILKLKEVSTKITDGEHGTVNRLEKGRLYLMARNITVNNSIDLSEVSFISEEDHQKIFKRCNPEIGDLMMVCVGATIGKVVLVPSGMEDFSMARSVALIKPDRKKINPQYLLWFFNSESGRRQIKNSSNEAAQAGLYTGKLKEIFIPVPPIELQNQFAQIVEKTEALKVQYQQSLQELENLYGSLSQRAFRGELTYKDEEDLRIAAEAASQYQNKADSTIPKNKRGFAKQVLGGKIVSLYKDDKNFSRIKFQKLQYLAEHIIEEDLHWNYYRQTAGPYDNKFMHSVAFKLKQNKWFEERNFKYYPLEKSGDIEHYFQNYFGNKSEKLNNLFHLFKNSTEKFSEAVATIYAVWNNHIILRQEFNKENIKIDFFEWSERKENLFTEDEFEKAMHWMQQHNIIPTGFGGLIKERK